jgi:hypothetical protein
VPNPAPVPVDAGFATWLKEGALYLSVSPDNAAAWAGNGVETEIVTPFALRAAAVAAGSAQADFLKGPNVKDLLAVRGARRDLIGRCIALTGDRMGYSNVGRAAFVLGAEELDNGTTILAVLRRLV